MSNNETKTIQLKIVSPVAKKFIDTLVQKVTEEGWTYNYDKVFTNPYKVFLTKEVYIDSEEPDITVVTGDFRKASAVEQVKYATKLNLFDPDNITMSFPDGVEIEDLANSTIESAEDLTTYNPDKVDILITGEEGSPTYKLLDENTGEVEIVSQDAPESIIPTPEEPVSDLVEELIPEPTTELIKPVEASTELQEKIGDGNVYTLELLKDIQWHKLTKIGSAYGLHAMKRGDMEAAIVNLSQGNKVDE